MGRQQRGTRRRGDAAGMPTRRPLTAWVALLGSAGLIAVVVTPAPGTAATASAATLSEVRSLSSACLRAPTERFPDVFSVHTDGVDCIGWWGVTAGGADGRYEPRRPVRREQMASFIDRTLTLAGVEPSDTPATTFSDLAGGVHDDAIARLAALEVVGGVAPDRFDPAGTVNRAQMASFLARAYEARTGEALPTDVASFSDIDGNVHADNIARIAGAGLTGGVDGDRFNPRGAVTRAQMGTFLARFLALMVDEGSLAYPPADPVPLPEDHDPLARFQGELVTPTPGDELPGADGPGPITVPVSPPVILASVEVDLQPGEDRRVRVPLTSPRADVHYWLDTGPPTTAFADTSCPEPGGRGIGTAAGTTTTFGDAALTARSEPDEQGCLRGAIWAASFGRAHSGDVAEIMVDNAGTQRFRSRLQVTQGAAFTSVVHPAGRTAAYAFDATRIDDWVRDLPTMHPLGVWRTRFEVEEASSIVLVEQPRVIGGTEFCGSGGRAIPVESLDPDAGEGGFVSPEAFQSPGRCELRFDTDGAASITLNVGNDNRMVFEVEPRR